MKLYLWVNLISSMLLTFPLWYLLDKEREFPITTLVKTSRAQIQLKLGLYALYGGWTLLLILR